MLKVNYIPAGLLRLIEEPLESLEQEKHLHRYHTLQVNNIPIGLLSLIKEPLESLKKQGKNLHRYHILHTRTSK